MLGMTVRSYLRDARRPVAYVPVYFGYDKLLEFLLSEIALRGVQGMHDSLHV